MTISGTPLRAISTACWRRSSAPAALSVAGDVRLGDHAPGGDTHQKLSRHCVSPSELLGSVLALIAGTDRGGEPQQVVEVFVNGDAPSHMDEREWRLVILDNQRNTRIALQVSALDRVRSGGEHDSLPV